MIHAIAISPQLRAADPTLAAVCDNNEALAKMCNTQAQLIMNLGLQRDILDSAVRDLRARVAMLEAMLKAKSI